MSKGCFFLSSGRFPRIPTKFSNDLQMTIEWMLQVDPANRPNCDELLEKIDEIKPEFSGNNYMDADHFDPIQESNDPMLATINLPPDMKLLEKKLPRSNYGKPGQPIVVNKQPRNNSALPPQGGLGHLKAPANKSRHFFNRFFTRTATSDG